MQKLKAVLVRSKLQAGNNKDFHVSRYRRLRTRPEEKKWNKGPQAKTTRGTRKRPKTRTPGYKVPLVSFLPNQYTIIQANTLPSTARCVN